MDRRVHQERSRVPSAPAQTVPGRRVSREYDRIAGRYAPSAREVFALRDLSRRLDEAGQGS